MSATVYINIDTLGRVHRSSKNLTPLLGAIGEMLAGNTKERFKNQVAPNGEPWRRTKRGGNSKKTLINTGRLMRSIHSRVAGKTIRVGTNVIYAGPHQFGTKPYVIRPKNKRALSFMAGGRRRFATHINHPGLVARPFLGLSQQDRRDIQKTVANYIRGQA